MAAAEPKTEGYPAAGDESKEPALGATGDEDGEDDGEGEGGMGGMDMEALKAMMGKGGGKGGEDDGEGGGGMGGMDMNALMAMMGKGGGKGGGMGGMGDMMGGMGGMMGGGMGGMGGKGGGKGEEKADESEKVCEKWVWSQKGEEVHVRIKLDPPASSKKDIEVKFKATTLVVKVRGEAIIDGPMGGKVEVDDCTWCFTPEKDELLLMLTKVDADADKHQEWKDLLAKVN